MKSESFFYLFLGQFWVSFNRFEIFNRFTDKQIDTMDGWIDLMLMKTTSCSYLSCFYTMITS